MFSGPSCCISPPCPTAMCFSTYLCVVFCVWRRFFTRKERMTTAMGLSGHRLASLLHADPGPHRERYVGMAVAFASLFPFLADTRRRAPLLRNDGRAVWPACGFHRGPRPFPGVGGLRVAGSAAVPAPAALALAALAACSDSCPGCRSCRPASAASAGTA
jgi:hypothetical protein